MTTQVSDDEIAKWFEAQKSVVDLKRFPNFMILGPQSTGTTWLYKNLNAHPNIWMVPKKETFFFCEENLSRCLSAGTDPDLNAYMNLFRPNTVEHLKHGLWALTRFGEPFRPTVIGEATASYAWQNETIVEGICSLNPGMRGVIMVRNPIDKIWSNMRRKVVRERGYQSAEDVPEEEVMKFLEDPVQIERSLFSKMIEKWTRHLGHDRVFIGRFDDIAEAPAELLQDIFTFLGLRSKPRYVTSLAEKKIRVGSSRQMSYRWRRVLEKIFAEELATLHQLYGFDWSSSESADSAA